VARVRADAGQWMILHGAPLLRDGSRRVAVIIERGDPDRLAPLLMAAYELTDREKDVTRLVLHGETTLIHRSQAVRLATDRSAASEEHLRQDRRPQSARTGRQGVLRAL